MTRSILRNLGASSLLLATPTWAQAPAPAAEVLTIKEAVALALQNNRRVAMVALEVERAEKRLDAYKTNRLPSLDLQGNAGTTLTPVRISFPAGAFGTFPDIGPIPAVDTTVQAPRNVSGYVSATAAQPLTQLYRIGLGTKLNALSRDAEKEKLRAERTAVAAETRRLYYALIQGQAAVAAAQENVKVYREMDRMTAEHVAQETALPAEAMDVKARLASAEYDAARLRNDLVSRKEQMNHLLGRDLAQEFTVVELNEPSPEEGDLPSALGTAMARRPDLAQARLAVDQAETDRRLKSAEAIPDVSLALTYTSFVNVDLLPAQFAQLGVQVKWEPFNWGRRGKERAEKALAVLQARSNAQEAQSRARMEVGQYFRKLQESQLLLDASRLARQAEHEKLRLATNRYQEEAALLKDLLQAQAAASEADSRWADALMSLWMARADFHKALGEDE